MFKVDEYGKVTVSLGGVCTLGCKHCYTMTKAFKHQSTMSPEKVVDRLLNLSTNFSTICISGDTDCFLDANQGLALIEQIVNTYSDKNIMFTTRLVPDSEIVTKID